MARVRGQDSLDDLAGKLTEGFNAVTLKGLQEQLVAAHPEASKVLTDFYKAAEALKGRENEFNKRSKPAGAPSLKANLRSADHFGAIKTFQTAKENLLAVDPAIGARIAQVVENSVANVSKPSPKRAFKAMQLA